MNPAYAEALAQAEFYRGLGYNALPSKRHVKGPMLDSFAEFWEQPLPDSVYSSWRTSNIQLMTGTHWRLAVVDCDGEEAHSVWRQMKNSQGFRGPMPTWVAKTGGGGWHYYFSLPDWLDECPGGRLWGVWDTFGGPKHQGDWQKHKEVRLLADRSLVVAPPSIHVVSDTPYYFLTGRSPSDYPRPMPAPAWLLTLPLLGSPTLAEPLPPPRIIKPRSVPNRPAGVFFERQPVLDAIDEKIALAKSWGLRVVGSRANTKGWWSCHAIDRQDNTPSASINEESGVYHELRQATTIPFFDLAVALGIYSTWQDARDDLGMRYSAPRTG
jgi:hypothetical protein